jgi:putative FmdB family regulatory protein
MPVYEYLCKKCNAIDEFDVPESQRKVPRYCSECGGKMSREFRTAPMTVTHKNEEPYMHPAFGVMMTDSQARKEARARGWVEVGDEDMDKGITPPKKADYTDENDFFV